MYEKDDKLYTVQEARDYFQSKVSTRLVYKLFHEGRLPGFRVGTKILLYRSGLVAFKDKKEIPPCATS